MFPLAWAGISTFIMRFMLGFSEAPSFPANARIVAAWFLTKERGTASAILTPHSIFCWRCFAAAGLVTSPGAGSTSLPMGVIFVHRTVVKFIHNPTDHPRMSQEELKFISENGAVVDMDHKKPGDVKSGGPKLHYIKQLLTNRMMLGVFFADSILSTHHVFFLAFLIFLVQEKGMSILKVGLVASILRCADLPVACSAACSLII
jgi:ACS family probable galactarate transporter